MMTVERSYLKGALRMQRPVRRACSSVLVSFTSIQKTYIFNLGGIWDISRILRDKSQLGKLSAGFYITWCTSSIAPGSSKKSNRETNSCYAGTALTELFFFLVLWRNQNDCSVFKFSKLYRINAKRLEQRSWLIFHSTFTVQIINT